MRLFTALLEQVYGGKKTPKKNKKSAIDLKNRKREVKIKKEFEPIDFKDCGCLPDCGCKEWVLGFKY